MTTKICVQCKKEKDSSEFYIKKNGKLHSWCNDCRKAKKHQWDMGNTEKRREYKIKNKEREHQLELKRRQDNPQRYIDTYTKYNELNKGKRRLQAQEPQMKEHRRILERMWRENNREHYNRYFHDYYERYPIKKVARNLRNRLYKLLKGEISSLHTKDLVGCSLEFLKQHLESQFKDGMTWDNYGIWHVDHIRPCESFDFRMAEEQKKCFFWTNLQPLWGPENISKNAKYNGVDYRNKK